MHIITEAFSFNNLATRDTAAVSTRQGLGGIPGEEFVVIDREANLSSLLAGDAELRLM